jgi:hypothetical protein
MIMINLKNLDYQYMMKDIILHQKHFQLHQEKHHLNMY